MNPASRRLRKSIEALPIICWTAAGRRRPIAMRTLRFVSITFLPLALAAQVDLRLPDGWIEDPAPSDLPAGITEMKSASSEDDAVEITIIATDPPSASRRRTASSRA